MARKKTGAQKAAGQDRVLIFGTRVKESRKAKNLVKHTFKAGLYKIRKSKILIHK